MSEPKSRAARLWGSLGATDDKVSPNGSASEPTRLERAAPLLVLAIVLAHAAAAWLLREPGFGWGEDDSAYFLLSNQLRHFSYREVQDVLAPIHARFPPVFPMLLAVTGALFGNAHDVLLIVTSVAAAGAVFLFYGAAERTVGVEMALLATLLFAINPTAIADGGVLMAEAPFKLFVMLALWALVREDEAPVFVVIAGAATCLAALTRTAGIVLVVALACYWLLQRRYRRVFVFGIVAIATVGLWLGYSFAAPDPDNQRLYIADIGARGRRASEGILTSMITRIPPRLRRILTVSLPTNLSYPTIEGTVVDNVFWLLSTLVFGLSGFAVLLRRWRGAAVFLLLYSALLVLWRYAVGRFLNPVAPLLYLCLLLGAVAVARSIRPSAARWTVGVLVALLAYGSLRVDAALVQRAIGCDRNHPETSIACWPTPERENLQLAAWVRDSTSASALFFVSKERAFFVHTARKSINQDRVLQEDSASVGDFLRSRHVDFVTVTPVGVRSRVHNHLVALACREFELVHRFSAQTLLLRVRPAPSSTDDETCASLTPWKTMPAPTP